MTPPQNTEYDKLIELARGLGMVMGSDPEAENGLGRQIVPAGSPPVLYHYTSIDALLSIIDKREIWCTESGSLNDHSEQHRFRELVRAAGVNQQEYFDRPKYVASFTAKGDQLSQWRAYAQGGVAIAFEFGKLRDLAARSRYFFMQCDYGEFKKPRGETHAVRVSGLVIVGTGIASQDNAALSVSLGERIIDLMVKMKSDDPQRAADLQNFAGRLGLLAPVAKADGFSEEAEWRLFGVEGISMFGEFVFHARPQIGIVPRALLKIGDPADPEWIAPVAGVVLSPRLSRDQGSIDRFKRNLGQFAASRKHPEIWVEESNIPLREV